MNRLTSDATLVRRALADTPAAFEELVVRYQRQATAIARALGVPRSTVEDVVQESFLHAFSGLGSLRSPEAFGPWLLGIVRNLARKEIEASRRTFDAARLTPGPEPDPGARSKDMEGIREHIWREVSKLPPRGGAPRPERFRLHLPCRSHAARAARGAFAAGPSPRVS